MDEAALTRQFYLNILKTETFPRRKIVDHQRRLLERLLRHARAHVPFYRDSGRLDAVFQKDGSIAWSRWSEIPILTRREAKDNEAALNAESLPPEMLPLEEDMTSGSTGVPFRFRRTRLSRVASRALLGRAIDWHDQGPIGTVAVVRALHPSLGRAASGTVTIPLDFTAREQLRLMEESAPTHLVTYPNQIFAWLDFNTSKAFRNLRVIILTGEVIRPEIRQGIADRLPAKIIEAYSTSEVGSIGYEGRGGGLRICEENVLFESVDESADTPGQVILTPLYNHATPLIRYAPGDFAVTDPASENDALRRIAKVIGRERNLFRAPSGVLFYPNISARLFVSILDHREWQLTQTTREEAVFTVVCPTPPTRKQLHELKQALAERLHGLSVTVVVTERIKPGATGKSLESIVRLPGID